MLKDGGWLMASHPFDVEDSVTGCPACKSVDSFDCACDIEGCLNLQSSGTPTPEGYARRCWEHRVKLEDHP